MAATFPTSPDSDKKRFWAATDNNSNNDQFNYLASKDGGDVWIMGRVEKEISEKSKNGGIPTTELGGAIIDSEEGDDYARYKTKNDEDHLKRTPFQRELYYFFEEPRGLAARLFSAFCALCTVGAVTLICINSLPKYAPSDRPLLMPLRVLFNVTFTVEYLGRFFASVKKRKFFFGLMSLIDVIAIISFFIQLAFLKLENATYSLRILQLVRIVRLPDVLRHSLEFQAAMKVVRRSSNQILFMLFWYIALIIVSSSLMFLTERGEFNPDMQLWYRRKPGGDPEVSPFQSIIHSFYWSVVTLTTTGYGDDIPYTVWGKIVTGVAITCGILFLVIPASIIGSNLSAEWTRANRLAKLKETCQLAHSPKDPALWQIRYLQRRNRELLEAIAEVQDVLAYVNPRKDTKIQMEHVAALKKIAELEASLDMWKKIACNHEYQQHQQYQQQQRQQQQQQQQQQQRDGYGQRQCCDTNFNVVDDKTSACGIESFDCMLPHPRMFHGFLTDADMISDGDYQSINEKATPTPTTPTRNDSPTQKSNMAITTTANVLNPFKMFRRCSSVPSKQDLPANAFSSSFDVHSIEHSIIAPESAYLHHTYKDNHDHPQSVMTAQAQASARLAPTDLLRSATLPYGECPKYNDKNVLSARESGLMDLFQQRIDATTAGGVRKTDEAGVVDNEKGGGNVAAAAIQSKKNNFLNRRAVDDCIISETDKNGSNIGDGTGVGDGSGSGGADDEAGDIEIIVERSVTMMDASTRQKI